MRTLKKAGLGLCFALLSVMIMSVSAFAAEADVAVAVGCTTGSSLRMRSSASTSSRVVTMLDKFMPVAVLEKLDNWYKVAFDGKTGYIYADYMIIDKDNVFNAFGWSNGKDVNVRADASTEADSVGSLSSGEGVTVRGFKSGWYAVTLADGTEGYVRSDFLNLRKTGVAGERVEAAVPVELSLTESGSSAVALAKQYVGTKYVYGGASPSGFDCSGFTMYIMRQLGVSLPHSATSQWQSGFGTKVYSVSDLQPGDLVYFNDPKRNAGKACSHTGFYIGGGEIIHASSSKSGVVKSDLTSGYYNKYFIGGLHY